MFLDFLFQSENPDFYLSSIQGPLSWNTDELAKLQG